MNEQGTGWTFSAVPNGEYTLEASELGTSGSSPGDGTVVVSELVTVACNPDGNPAAGSFLHFVCQGVDRYRMTANGNGGEVPTLEEANSVACGYVPPVDLEPEPEPIWVGLWAPEGIPVIVTPEPDGPAFVEADLYVGFPEGHPLALAPYLRSEVGALLSSDSQRLDLNTPTAQTEDVYVGYQLTLGGATIAQGYALNSVLSTEQLDAYVAGRKLSPFGNVLPLWPGYEYQVSRLRADFTVEAVTAGPGLSGGGAYINIPCPRYGMPVAWLSPEGGFGYWVFSGQCTATR